MVIFSGPALPRVCCQKTEVSYWKTILFKWIVFSEGISLNVTHLTITSIMYGVASMFANKLVAAASNPPTKILLRCVSILCAGLAVTVAISILFQRILNNLKPSLQEYKKYLENYVEYCLSEHRFEKSLNAIQQINQLARRMNDSEYDEKELNAIKHKLMKIFILKMYCDKPKYLMKIGPDLTYSFTLDEKEPRILGIQKMLRDVFTDVDSKMLDYYSCECVKYIWSREDPKGAQGDETDALMFIEHIDDQDLKAELVRQLKARTSVYESQRIRDRGVLKKMSSKWRKDLEKGWGAIVSAHNQLLGETPSESHEVKIEVVEAGS